MSSLRIATRLWACFGLLLAVPLGLAGLAVLRMQDLSQAYTHLVAEQAELLAVGLDIADNGGDAARNVLVLLGSSPERQREAREDIRRADGRMAEAAQVLDHRLQDAVSPRALAGLNEKLRLFERALGSTLLEMDGSSRQAELLSSRLEPALASLVSATRDVLGAVQVSSIQEATRLRDQIQSDRNLILILGALTVAGAGLLAMAIVQSVLRPLERARAGAQAVAAGDYHQHIPVEGRDELSQLSESMNALMVAVDDRQQRLLAMAHTDGLTNMALRSRFSSGADLHLARHESAFAALLCLDVDRLKTVNNVLGFTAGDSLLLGLARRLERLQSEGALCGRLAGGTFVVLLPLAALEDWRSAVSQAQGVLNRRHDWQGQTLDLTVSIGVALYPEHGQNAETLMQRAEQAMFEAKRLRTDVVLYDPELEADRLAHLSLLSELETAITQGQLCQILQPKLRLKGHRITGAEALVRWRHPTRGWLPPSEFVPFAESTGRIRQITHWMLERAITTLAEWQAQGREVTIAVNISTLDLQDTTLPERIQGMLRQAGVPARLLQLELTETGLMASTQDPIHVMHSLRSLGVRLAIDDFGTGQSSLAYLQRLPVHELKIDRSFVDGVDQDLKRQELLGSIIMLGHGLGLEVTAEGVETQAELDILRRLGCDLVQGYFVAKPMDTALFNAALCQSLEREAVDIA